MSSEIAFGHNKRYYNDENLEKSVCVFAYIWLK